MVVCTMGGIRVLVNSLLANDATRGMRLCRRVAVAPARQAIKLPVAAASGRPNTGHET
jgi:hypothetical protein